MAVLAFLLEHGIQIEANTDELYKMVIKISTGEIHFDEIVAWLKANTAKK